ncbi:MAG: hypothetical protein ABSC17_06620 [Thermacetogeniaceae bacterium]
MATTGDKPGIGYYRCTRCSEIIHLDNTTDTLPPCPTCHGTNFRKL